KELIAEATAGRSVVRLVFGDPMTADAVVTEASCVATGSEIPFDVVPGVPSATAVPSYAGIPLGSAYTVADVRSGVDWARLAAGPEPLVLHATAAHLPEVAAGLTGQLVSGQTPVSVTTEGTGAVQRTVVT